jgi:hypothetical protein
MGLADIDQLLDEDGNPIEKPEHQRAGVVGAILDEMRAMQQKQAEQEGNEDFTNADMMAGLESLTIKTPDAEPAEENEG